MPQMFPPVNGPFTAVVNKKTFTSAGQYQAVTVTDTRDAFALQEKGWTDSATATAPNMTTLR